MDDRERRLAVHDMQPKISLPEVAQLPAQADQPADELYRLWQIGRPPDLKAFLASREPLSPADLAAVIRVDQRCRWQTGQCIPAESYLANFPKLLDDRESALDFIYGELLLCEQQGAAPGLEEFVAGF